MEKSFCNPDTLVKFTSYVNISCRYVYAHNILYIYMYIYIRIILYIYVYACVCACVCLIVQYLKYNTPATYA